MKISPFGERVLVRPEDEEDEVKIGSIYVPNVGEIKHLYGTVVAVGTGKEVKDFLKKGDRVMFMNLKLAEFRVDGEAHVMLHKDLLMGKLEGTPKKLKEEKEEDHDNVDARPDDE